MKIFEWIKETFPFPIGFLMLVMLALLIVGYGADKAGYLSEQPCINLYYETDEFYYNQSMTMEKFIHKIGIMQNTSRELKNASVQMMVMDCEE